MHVMIVEDHELLAESLRLALSAEGMTVTVARRFAMDEILDTAAVENPDVVLLDLDLGQDDLDGSMLIEPLTVAGSRVVVVSASEDRTRIGGCIESGAVGYLSKERPLDDLLAAVRQTAAGERIMTEPVRQDMLAELRRARATRRRELAPFEALTEREGYVLSQMLEGLSAAAIAKRSFVSEATVRTQIKAVLGKLGVRSQLAAAAEARRVGWRSAAPTRPTSAAGGH